LGAPLRARIVWVVRSMDDIDSSPPSEDKKDGAPARPCSLLPALGSWLLAIGRRYRRLPKSQQPGAKSLHDLPNRIADHDRLLRNRGFDLHRDLVLPDLERYRAHRGPGSQTRRMLQFLHDPPSLHRLSDVSRQTTPGPRVCQVEVHKILWSTPEGTQYRV